MRYTTQITLVISLVLCVALIAPLPVGAGGEPNGKPFQALRLADQLLQEQIDQMQITINNLMVDVTSLEGRIAINEQFIADLKNQDAEILARLEELQALVGANTAKLAVHDAEIGTLREDLAVNTAKISYLEGQIADMQATLQTKQDILDGRCPDGYFLREIDPAGGIVCGMDTTGSNGLQQTIVSHTAVLLGQYEVCDLWLPIFGCVSGTTYYPAYNQTNYCPAGYALTGGGFDYNHNGRSIALDVSKPVGNGWNVLLNNYGNVDLTVHSYAVCVKLQP